MCLDRDAMRKYLVFNLNRLPEYPIETTDLGNYYKQSMVLFRRIMELLGFNFNLKIWNDSTYSKSDELVVFERAQMVLVQLNETAHQLYPNYH